MITAENYHQYRDTIDRWRKRIEDDRPVISAYLRPDLELEYFNQEWAYWMNRSTEDDERIALALAGMVRHYLTEESQARLENNVRMQNYRKNQPVRDDQHLGPPVRIQVHADNRKELNTLASELKTSVANVVHFSLRYLEESAIKKHKSSRYLLEQIKKKTGKATERRSDSPVKGDS